MPAQPGRIDGTPALNDGEFSETWQLDSTALLRNSALNFNGHRIHYDANYARTVEGYPNLVIHGPLLATLMMDLAVHERGPLHTFRYGHNHPSFSQTPSPSTADTTTTNRRCGLPPPTAVSPCPPSAALTSRSGATSIKQSRTRSVSDFAENSNLAASNTSITAQPIPRPHRSHWRHTPARIDSASTPSWPAASG